MFDKLLVSSYWRRNIWSLWARELFEGSSFNSWGYLIALLGYIEARRDKGPETSFWDYWSGLYKKDQGPETTNIV